MPLFSLLCLDKPGALDVRKATRPAHLEYVDAAGVVKLGGPVSDPVTGDPVGSLMIVEAESLDAARAYSAADPYAKAGLFESVDIRPFTVVRGEL